MATAVNITVRGGGAGSFVYPAGVVPHLGGYALGSTFLNETNTNKRILYETGNTITTTGVWPKIAYTTGMQSFGSPLSPGGSGGLAAARATAESLGAMLHSVNGNEFLWQGGGGNGYLVDPGNAAWQNACKTTLLNWLATTGTTFRGFEWDNWQDTVTVFGGTTPDPIGYPVFDQNNQVLYSDSTDFQAAAVSFAQNVIKPIRDAGYFCTVNGRPNTPTATLWPNWTDQYDQYVSAMGIEFWLYSSSAGRVWLANNDLSRDWNGAMVHHERLTAHGCGFCPFPNMGAAASFDSIARYTSGSYLLCWSGIPPTSQYQGASALLVNGNGSTSWNANLDHDLGAPLVNRYARTQPDSNNGQVWRRDFAKGSVLVNPTVTQQTVDGVTIPSGDAVFI